MRAPIAVLSMIWVASPVAGQETPEGENAELSFVQLVVGDWDQRERALGHIRESWRDDYLPMLLETLAFTPNAGMRSRLVQILQEKTGQAFGYDLDAWYRWMWNREALIHPTYPSFKGRLYGLIDPAFARYFSSRIRPRIRLDEVRWGGVRQDGIPPLRHPGLIPAEQAGYLDDDNLVFGLEISGETRAYPKRILAWHEMVIDEVGGIPVAGVYCTLCGSMVVYRTEIGDRRFDLGTSGFLYRSNKLMYDRETQSLWSSMWGRPVVGELAEEDIQLERLPVVTTTWGEWRRRHPGTSVLSAETGHQRDYTEGAAYREYFATDELMFEVPSLDRRLKNKDEVLGLPPSASTSAPLAISVRFLRTRPVFHADLGGEHLVVLTDATGASRVYQAGDHVFARFDRRTRVVDSRGRIWSAEEDRLQGPEGQRLARIPAHRAFWFGWYAAYPSTRLIHE